MKIVVAINIQIVHFHSEKKKKTALNQIVKPVEKNSGPLASLRCSAYNTIIK